MSSQEGSVASLPASATGSYLAGGRRASARSTASRQSVKSKQSWTEWWQEMGNVFGSVWSGFRLMGAFEICEPDAGCEGGDKGGGKGNSTAVSESENPPPSSAITGRTSTTPGNTTRLSSTGSGISSMKTPSSAAVTPSGVRSGSKTPSSAASSGKQSTIKKLVTGASAGTVGTFTDYVD